jgi:hypothetical protein
MWFDALVSSFPMLYYAREPMLTEFIIPSQVYKQSNRPVQEKDTNFESENLNTSDQIFYKNILGISLSSIYSTHERMFGN